MIPKKCDPNCGEKCLSLIHNFDVITATGIAGTPRKYKDFFNGPIKGEVVGVQCPKQKYTQSGPRVELVIP